MPRLPTVSYKQLVRALHKAGFYIVYAAGTYNDFRTSHASERSVKVPPCPPSTKK